MSRPPLLRRQFLVHEFQYRLLFVTFVYFVTAVLIFGIALFTPLITGLQNPSLSPVERSELGGLFLQLHARFWPAIGVVFLLLGFHSIVTSNRIAGPLFRIRKTLERVGEGDLSAKVSIRETDYLHTDVDALNDMLAGLRKRITELRDSHVACRVPVRTLRRAVSEAKVPEIEAALLSLLGSLDEVEQRMLAFRVEPE